MVSVLGDPTTVMGMDSVMGLPILTPCIPVMADEDAIGWTLTVVDLTVGTV